MRSWCWLLAFTALLLAHGPRRAGASDSEGLEFFEKRIRPILEERCLPCHSAKAEAAGKLEAGLRVDSRAGLLEGGDNGPALVPGDPDSSLLIQTIRYDDVTKMPPDGRLPDTAIRDLEEWVRRGAPDTRDGAAAAPRPRGSDDSARREHWAYQAPRPTEPPDVLDSSWPLGPIDRYVLDRLEERGLGPGVEADRFTLIRRLSFDLRGLPPEPGEIRDFVGDASIDAYERLVDRLLASPRFGERWGRHWLDLARHAESLTLRGFVLPDAWRYRDLVIDCFNSDLPFDRFALEQLAGDLLPPTGGLETERRRLIAPTFLLLGDTNLEEQDKRQLEMDIVDEQLDTMGKVFLAQTLGCARCHDHKFDPFTTADYHALAGIFANTRAVEHANVSKWLERPLPMAPELEVALAARLERVSELRESIDRARAQTGTRSGPVPASSLPGLVIDDVDARRVGAWAHSTHHPDHIGDGYLHDADEGKGEKSLTFEPERLEPGVYEVRLAYTPGENRAAAVPVTVGAADGERELMLDLRLPPASGERFVSLGRHRFERGGLAYVLVSNRGTSGHVVIDAVQWLRDQATPPAAAPSATDLSSLEAELRRLESAGPRGDRALALFEKSEIVDIAIHVRGSVHRLGPVVARGLPSFGTEARAPAMPSDQSGRLELAAWVTSTDNPLTGRVFVNRAWRWLMGEGLVRTVDQFGTTGEPPSHPELLDHLALRFVQEGWSIKRLVREIVLSRTYRQSTTGQTAARDADPENRLLGRALRRRLDAECLRDAMLVAAGQLDQRMHGPNFSEGLAADYGQAMEGSRRTIYGPIFRNALPDVLKVFDFPDPGMVVGRRETSTNAPQALWILNSPFVLEQARLAGEYLRREDFPDDSTRLEFAFLRILGRPPSPDERSAALDSLSAAGSERLEGWANLCHSLFASLDFRFVE